MAEEGSSLEEIGFNWGEYLEETGASAAPHTSFKHVRNTPVSFWSAFGGAGGASAGRCRSFGEKREIEAGFLRHQKERWTSTCFLQITAGKMGLVITLDLFW